jgi:putative PIN family toxin of toxin-antitoxin system
VAAGPAAAAAAGAAVPASAPRIVLDTNVALALWVFADPRLALLRSRLDASVIVPAADDATLAEFERVLRYPDLKLEESSCIAVTAVYRARCVAVPLLPAVAGTLPRCRDPDDQKFLQLAQRAGARWLLTRDKSLLRLRKAVRFRIAPPEAWLDETDGTGRAQA